MMKYWFLVFIWSSVSLKAQTVDFLKGNKTHYDWHVVAQGETLYGLSKKYNTTVEELLRLNPDIVNNSLPLGKTVKVPVVKEDASAGVKHKKMENTILHKVKKGETAYSLSKTYHTDVATFLMWNDLKDPAIQEGQEVIVGYENPKMNLIGPLEEGEILESNEEITEKKTEAARSGATVPQMGGSSMTSPAGQAMILYDEKGIAVWTHSDYDDGNLYALHPTAPKGTEITLTNLMNHKSIKVKVIGKLPATSENENVAIKISESAAKKLNVLDEKFLVELTYMAPEVQDTSKN